MSRIPLYENTKRTIKDTEEERDLGYARMLDLKNRNRVELRWDLSEEMRRDGVLSITIGGKEAVLDAEQLRKFIRWA